MLFYLSNMKISIIVGIPLLLGRFGHNAYFVVVGFVNCHEQKYFTLVSTKKSLLKYCIFSKILRL